MKAEQTTHGRRVLGLGDVVGLGINCVVGSGIFLLPGPLAEGLGPASIVAVLGAGTLALLLALCFAEAATYTDATGGAHAYAQVAFGSGVGFVVGWTATLAGVFAWAALVNAWSIAVSTFVPSAADGWGRAATQLALVVFLAAINLRGITLGSRVSFALSTLKLTSLAVFVVAGLWFVSPARFTPLAPMGWGGLTDGILLMLYAFVGFENLVVPAGEMKRPARAVPLALGAIMVTVTLLYLGVQVVAVGTLDDLGGRATAVADAAASFAGPVGGTIAAIVVLISILGVNAASAIVLPHRMVALASLGPLPRWLGAMSERFRAPRNAILLGYVVVAVVAATGSFRQLVQVAVIARFLQYAPTCFAVLSLRRRSDIQPVPGGFRLPLGPTIPVVALVLSALLLTRAEPSQLALGLVAAGLGIPIYVLAHRRRTP